MDDQNKNLILATTLSFLVIMVWFLLFPPPPPQDQVAAPTEASQQAGGVATPAGDGGTTTVPGLGATPAEDRAAALETTERVSLSTPRLTGSISLRGGRIDDLKLSDYRETIEEDADIVTLFSPARSPNAYYALHGWAPGTGLGAEDVPGANTDWSVESGSTLSPGSPLTLLWTNANGVEFRKTISVDENFLFSITQSITNTSDQALRTFPYGIIAREGEPELTGFFVLHEGIIGTADGSLNEPDYDDVRDYDINPAERTAAEITPVEENGWIGFTDHYWMSTLVARPGQSFTSVVKHTAQSDTFQTDMRLPAMDVPAGQTVEVETFLFAGAKEWEVLKNYEDSLGIQQFVDAIDWGWFAFLTKPIFIALHYLKGLIGNMGWAIIGLTVIIKTLLLPLAYKSYVSMSKMKKLQPDMEKIKERAGDDRMKLQQEMMALYKKEKVNPASGCLPILLQIPIFFSLYKVIFVTIDLRHEPFFGWIRDLSAPDPTSYINLFGLLPWGAPDPTSLFAIFSIGVFPILMGVTMWMQQKLNPSPTDKTQAMIFAWMPWVFMFMLGGFASGLVIYWCANNILTFIQQYSIMRSQGVKPDIFGNITGKARLDKSSEK